MSEGRSIYGKLEVEHVDDCSKLLLRICSCLIDVSGEGATGGDLTVDRNQDDSTALAPHPQLKSMISIGHGDSAFHS